jgi:hypothetical protein
MGASLGEKHLNGPIAACGPAAGWSNALSPDSTEITRIARDLERTIRSATAFPHAAALVFIRRSGPCA